MLWHYFLYRSILVNIIVVIVTYNPNISQLKACIASLLPQSEKLIVVKNSDERLDDADFQSEKIVQMQLDRNYGIAYAQNVGIRRAIELGADWMLLSDQDTVFPEQYASRFSAKIEDYDAETIYVPVFFNETKKQIEPVSVTMSESVCPDGISPVPLIHGISSGTIFHKGVFEKIGGMDEKLFIDYVDFEWCWRARFHGIRTLCFPDIVVRHQLGDSYARFFGRKITVRSDVRYYYMLRNGIYLGRSCEFISKDERKILLRRTLLFALGIIAIAPKKIKAIRLVSRAISDGRKMGDKK